MATVELTQRMMVEISNGVPKSESKLDLKGENGKLYDRLKIQIEAIWDKGGSVEIPPEIA